MQEELAQARRVWRDAQQAVIKASARRYEDLPPSELKQALDDYENAVETMSAAKNHYDIVRAEAEQSDNVVMCRPRAC